MLLESELDDEIKLLESKIDAYELKIEPYTILEGKFLEELKEKFTGNRFSNIDVRVVISQKSALEANLKRWKNELLIYKRIKNGKRMERLQ